MRKHLKRLGRRSNKWRGGFPVDILEPRQMFTFSVLGTETPFGSTSPVGQGYSPPQIRKAYNLDSVQFASGASTVAGDGTGQTIAIIVAYNNPHIASDLAAFDSAFMIAAPPSFTVVSQTGSTTSLPTTTNAGWATETAFDVEWAHALAPNASILLVEANTPSDLYTAVSYATSSSGVSVISMSWGSPEFSGETSDDGFIFDPFAGVGAFAVPKKITFVAGSGDSGNSGGPSYPASSPNVVGVGGTALVVNSTTNAWSSETGWQGSGGGPSAYENVPTYQGWHIPMTPVLGRKSPDVAFSAGKLVVYDSINGSGGANWFGYVGTSTSTPCWASIIAIANQGRSLVGFDALNGSRETLPMLYSMASTNFHDITSGNTKIDPVYEATITNTYSATSGNDYVTGRGTPIANLVIGDLMGNTQFVNHLYSDLLGRAADSTGLATWLNALTSGTSRASVTTSILTSAEYRGRLINTDYLTYLGRGASSSDQTYWVSQMSSGLSAEGLITALVASTEFYNDAAAQSAVYTGESNNDKFLDRAYSTMLGRTVDSSGRSYFDGQFAIGKTTTDIAAAIDSGDEYYTRLSGTWYTAYLGRSETSGDISYTLGQYHAGKTDEQLIAGIFASTEYALHIA